MSGPALVGMPAEGVWRAGRWSDVDKYPGAEEPVDLAVAQQHGARWEDAHGRFSTAKCSATAEAAIGRVIARYRPRIMPSEHPHAPGKGLINAILGFLENEPDYDNEPDLVDGVVPPDVNDDLYLIHVPYQPVAFIDLAHKETIAAVDQMLRPTLDALGIAQPVSNLCKERDRRITRLALQMLHSRYADGSIGPIAGVRYPGEQDLGWEAFVLWSQPTLVSLTGEEIEFRWVAHWDEDFQTACKRLGLGTR